MHAALHGHSPAHLITISGEAVQDVSARLPHVLSAAIDNRLVDVKVVLRFTGPWRNVNDDH